MALLGSKIGNLVGGMHRLPDPSARNGMSSRLVPERVEQSLFAEM